MATEALVLKGDKQGIRILINATFTEREILEDLENKISNNLSFFKNSEVIIDSSTCEKISHEFYNQLKNILEKNLNIRVASTYESYLSESKKKAEARKTEVMETEFVIGSIRSGQFIEVPGHIVITGDVNAGAQVHADGNIVVMGIIRGTVHGGYSGDRTSMIICKSFRAPQAQIRIANLIVFKKDNEHKNYEDLEIAHIENDEIVLLSKDKMFR